eukprot:276415-Chlamydomonas_euryale.AAC.1
MGATLCMAVRVAAVGTVRRCRGRRLRAITRASRRDKARERNVVVAVVLGARGPAIACVRRCTPDRTSLPRAHAAAVARGTCSGRYCCTHHIATSGRGRQSWCLSRPCMQHHAPPCPGGTWCPQCSRG